MGTKMKKRRLMRVTLWQENYMPKEKKVTNSTFLTTTLKCIQKKTRNFPPILLGCATMKNTQNGRQRDEAKMRRRHFTTDITKMKKQRLTRVTLWQENYMPKEKKVTNSTFPTTALKYTHI